MRLEKPKKDKFSKNLKKKFYQKIAETSDIKLENISRPIKIFQCLIIKSLRKFSDPFVWKDLNNQKYVKKIARFVRKDAKIRDVRMLVPFHYH